MSRRHHCVGEKPSTSAAGKRWEKGCLRFVADFMVHKVRWQAAVSCVTPGAKLRLNFYWPQLPWRNETPYLPFGRNAVSPAEG